MTGKNILEMVGFGIGSFAGYLFGPCDSLLLGLLTIMAVDIAMGVITGISGVSTKTEKGGISSKAMAKGIAKKGGELLIVILGNILDLVSGLTVVRAGVCMSLIVAESLSILENAALLDIVSIPAINKILEVLKEKENE